MIRPVAARVLARDLLMSKALLVIAAFLAVLVSLSAFAFGGAVAAASGMVTTTSSQTSRASHSSHGSHAGLRSAHAVRPSRTPLHAAMHDETAIDDDDWEYDDVVDGNVVLVDRDKGDGAPTARPHERRAGAADPRQERRAPLSTASDVPTSLEHRRTTDRPPRA